MLRLAPSFPPLWRTPTTLQLGVDAALRVEGVEPWQERVIDALVNGTSRAGVTATALAFGATAADAAAFLERLRGALREQTPAPSVRVEIAEDVPFADADAYTSALSAAGVEVVDVSGWAGDGDGPPVVLVAPRLIDPRRAARFVARDIPHLPVVLSGDRVDVGPYVQPGDTACLACMHAARTDADPQWPALAVQLLARGPIDTDGGLLLEAATLSGRLLQAGGGDGLAAAVTSTTWRRAWRAHRPHPRCWCRAPGGIATADAPAAPRYATSSVAPTALPA